MGLFDLFSKKEKAKEANQQKNCSKKSNGYDK